MKPAFDFINGDVLLINKPLYWTSFQAVNKLKFALNRAYKRFLLTLAEIERTKLPRHIKIGHAGTLDPLATGLLIICTGKKTKDISQFQMQEKEYTGRFFLGATTICYDLEKEPDQFFETNHITSEMIYATAKTFEGEIMQAPPAHSAVMIDGKRAYELARQGKEPEMKLKPVSIYKFEITNLEMPYVSFRVVCSKGTYIRSLANDFGKALGSGAYLAELCRTRIGTNFLEDASSVDEVVKSLETIAIA